jgi:predicted Zn-dependent peptidase
MEKERTVILEEIKMYLDIPSSHVQEILGEMLWENQPLGRNIAGTEKTVSPMTRKKLLNFFEAAYHPANVLIAACGNIRHDELVAQAESRFRKLPQLEESCFEPADSSQGAPQLRFLEKKTEQCHWVLGLHGLEKNHPDRYKLGLLHVILGANMSSRLFNEVREKRGLAYSIHSSISSFMDTGSFTVSAGVATPKAAEALRISLRELKKIAKKGVSKDELRRAKDYFLGQLLLMLEDTLDHMVWAGEKFLYFGKCPDRTEIRREVEKVSLEDIKEIAERIFVSEHLNLALIGPVKPKEQNKIRRFFSFENC